MTARPTIGIGILSWLGHDSLARSLPSYTAERLFDLADDAMLLVAEPREETVALGLEAGLRVDSVPHNLGILGGFQRIAETLRTDLLLLLEDDCPLIEPHAECARQLALGAEALASGEVQVFRLRHRIYPGAGKRFGIVDKLHRYCPPPDAPLQRQVAAALRRTLRPGKLTRLSSNVLYEGADPHHDPYVLNATRGEGSPAAPADRVSRDLAPEALFPRHIEKTAAGWYRVGAAAIPWSNQSILVGRNFYLDQICAYAARNPSRRQVGGFPNVERELNGAYWRNSGWHVGLDRGLFAHELV